MNKSVFFVCASLVLVSLVPSSWGQPALDLGGPVIGDAALSRVGYRAFWELSLPSGGDPVFGAYLLDENLYVTTRSGAVFAIQADTGLLRWIQNLNETQVLDRAPTHVQTADGRGPVMFVTHAAVHVFDRYSGEDVRHFALPFPAGGGAVANPYLMGIGDAGGKLYALQWSANRQYVAIERWEVLVRGVVRSTPVSIFDRWYVVSDGGGVYCLRPTDKLLHWAYRVGGDVAGGLHVDESGVYVASTDRTLQVLDADTGSLIHAYRLPSPLYDTPEVVQRTCYQYCPDAGVYAFDVDTRAQLWVRPGARRYVARAAENLVLLSESNALLFVDNASGEVRQTVALSDGVLAVRNTRDAVLYLVSADGRITCATPKGYPYLRREAVARSRAGLSQPPTTSKDESTVSSIENAPDTQRARDPLRSASGG